MYRREEGTKGAQRVDKGGEKETVSKEAARVLKPGGRFTLTDPMRDDDCPEGVLQPIPDRIHLDSLGSPGF